MNNMQAIVKPIEKIVKPPTPKPPKTKNKYIKDSVWVNKELQSMVEAAQADKQIITKVQLFASKQYTTGQFYNWRKKYTTIPSIQHRLKKIDELIHSNLIYRGQTSNPAFPIFILKNNWGYQDKREVTTDNNYTFTVNRGLPTPQQARKLVKAQVNKKT